MIYQNKIKIRGKSTCQQTQFHLTEIHFNNVTPTSLLPFKVAHQNSVGHFCFASF